MLFSERYGHKKVPILKKDEMPESLRTRIWNVLYRCIFRSIGDPDVQMINQTYDPLPYRFLTTIWVDFFGGDLMAFDELNWPDRVNATKNKYDLLKWFEVYDFVEFVVRNYEGTITNAIVLKEIELTFKEERASYCVINDEIVPIMSEEERKEIEKALSIPDKYKPARDHLSKALELFSKRPEPDYANSIKESISAVESLVQIVLGEKGTLSELINKLDIHPAMKKGFEKLYNWTSDASGIRHGEYGESFPCGEAEARFMLVTCSAFLSYVISKYETIK